MKTLVIVLLLCYSTAQQNMDSENDIRTYCSKAQSTLSLWQQHVCEATFGSSAYTKDVFFTEQADRWDTCWPQTRRSTCDRADFRGIVVAFHGYTACPQAYNEVASVLQSYCFDVLSPLSPGHGRKRCDFPLADGCSNGSDVSGFPTTAQQYSDFVRSINSAVEEYSTTRLVEVGKSLWDINIGTMGLSLGAPLATHALTTSNLYTHSMIISPFFGITVPDTDMYIGWKCPNALGTDLVACLRTGLTEGWIDGHGQQPSDNWATQLFDLLVVLDQAWFPFFQEIQTLRSTYTDAMALFQPSLRSLLTLAPTSFLETYISWGDKCLEDRDHHERGGVCDFRIEHILAAHAFAGQVVAEAEDIAAQGTSRNNHSLTNLHLQMVGVQRDEYSRNGIAWRIMAAVEKVGTANGCIYMLGCTDRATNECGVPHSAFAVADNIGVSPYELWWMPKLEPQVADFFAKGRAVGEEIFGGDRNTCWRQNALAPSTSVVTYPWPTLFG